MGKQLERPEVGRPNKVVGAIIVAQHTGKPLPYPLPSVDDRTHSPNTEMGRIAACLKAYPPPHKLAPRVAERAVENLEYMQRHGHQKIRKGNEFNTDGHFPHWCRVMSAGYKSALELLNKGAAYGRIADLYLEWWCNQYWLMKALSTPGGKVVGLGARFEGGWREERDWAFALLSGIQDRQIKGEKFWRNAQVNQDIFGLHLLRLLVDDGHFARLHPIRPSSAGPFVIKQYAGGHVTQGERLGGPPPPPAMCWVRYADGETGTSEPPSLGELHLKLRLEAAPGEAQGVMAP